MKQYADESFYHVYTRGVAKQKVFLDAQDYGYFLGLFKRYLSMQPAKSAARIEYPWYSPRIDLIAYCLMPNHIHLLVYQQDASAMQDLLRSIMTSYAMYFNKRYKRVGPIFQSRYKASLIDRDNYLDHISRYIHLNPTNWQQYEYSSLPYYLRQKNAEWLKPETILSTFKKSPELYLVFLKDYKEQKAMLDELKWELANDIK